jgi:hypothetical protein
VLSKLKDDILRLLKEDEEFRYAVIGLLGLQRLEEAIAKLTSSHIELKGVIARQDERLAKLEEIVSKLADIQTKTESRLSSIENIISRQDERLAKLEEIFARQELRLTKLEETVNRLAEMQSRQEERLTKLEEIVARQEERLTKLEETVSKLVDITAKMESRLTMVESRLNKVESRLTTVEISIGSFGRRLGRDMEKMILNIYKDQLMQIGINPDNARRFKYVDEEGKYGRKGKEYEFDIVVSDDYTDVLEVKARTEREDVEWFHENVESIKSLFDKPLRRKVIVTVHIDDEALIKANELSINVIYGNVIKE